MKFFILCLLFVSALGQERDGCASKSALRSCLTAQFTAGAVPDLCASATRPTCAVNTALSALANSSISCYSCLPRELVKKLCNNFPKETCADGVSPIAVADVSTFSLCPSCIPEYKRTCDRTKIKKCVSKLKSLTQRPKVCGADDAQTSKDCCPTCMPKTFLITAKQYTDCAKGYKDLEDCAALTEITRGDDGCQSCKKKIKAKFARATKADKCTKATFKAAIRELRDCEMGEKPVVSRELLKCGPSCRRPSSKYKLEDVVDCLKDLPTCEADEKPVFLPEERCISCKPPRPTCDPACVEDKVCVRKKRNGTVVTRCVGKGHLKLKLKAKGKRMAKKLKDLSKEQVVEVLGEMVERFCERNEVADKCEKFKESILESLKCKKKTHRGAADGGLIAIEVEYADDVDESTDTDRRRHLLQTTDDATTLLTDAAADDEDVEGSIDTDSEGSGASKTMCSLFIIVTSLFGLFAF